MDLTTRVNLVQNLLKTKELPVKTGAALLDINRTSVYYKGTPISQDELDCKSIIDRLHTDNPTWGARLEKEVPVIEGFLSWLDLQKPIRGSRMDKAVTYIQNRRTYLMTYLEDGRCSFSNNLSENAIRPFTVGRKNWLFCDTPNGAQASAIVYTMVEMAQANGVNVYHYLTYLLEKQPNDSMSDEELDQLAPWNEDVKAELKRRAESSDE